jgi:spore coat protein U-like protein
MRHVQHVRNVVIGLGILGALSAGAPAVAGTATTTFQVTATVNATCLISAGVLAFGTYTGALAAASSTVTATCTNTTPYNVGLDPGTFAAATTSTRRMTGPDALGLGYSLFRDAGHTLNWGDVVATDTLAGTGNGSAQALTVYGQVPAGEFVKPGSYADTITAIVTF